VPFPKKGQAHWLFIGAEIARVWGMARQLSLKSLFCAAGLLVCSATTSVPDEGRVDVALAIAIDVSYSVDSTEHRLQMQGFGTALQSAEVLDAIRKGKHQRIAITVYQWSDELNQRVLVPWSIIASEEDAKKLGDYLATDRREVAQGGTAISASLVFGSTLFDTAPPADRKVIDLATDGRNNIGRPAREARDFVVGQGITINGLAVSNEWKQLAGYLEKQVIGGSSSFVEDAQSYDDFGAAMLRKLVREISGPGVT
jgi:Protein of unknown function (DUF1194)